MGKAGRIACIAVPWAMTIVALVLLIIVELGGKSTGSSVLNDVYAWQADFTNLTADSSAIGTRLEAAKTSGKLASLYQIHVYNYCSANVSSTGVTYCSPRENGFVFDFINTWHLNDTTTSKRSLSDTISSAQDEIKTLFGEGVLDSLNAYNTASKWMSIAFQVALWTGVGTAVAALLAIFSRWGSFITWILSIVSSIFSFGAAITSTIIFGALVGALKAVLDPYKVSITIGNQFLAYVWISTALSLGATIFWLASVCCCSGKSNPHHRSNKGGLWQAEPKDHGRGMRVQQTGGYQRVSSPYIGAGDRVPLHDYPAPMPTSGYQHNNAYEPYRYQK